MRVAIFIPLILSACLSNVLSFNQTRLADECLKGLMLSETENLKCVTDKGVSIQMVKRKLKTFYCIKYEKRTGNVNTYDVLSFDLNEDYELKFTGANVVSNEELTPQFKLYDTRLKNFYKGKFAFASENKDFDIKNVLINEEDQTCQSKKRQVWPVTTELFESTSLPMSTVRTPMTTTMRSSAPKTPKPETSQEISCGKVKKIEHFDNFLSLPSMPGEFPWMVAIYRYFGDEEEPFYKCAGTIIDGLTILTSANCLLEDGLLLSADDFQVHVSPFSLSAKIQKIKIYNVAALNVHEYFNFQLEHNIAMMKLSKNIKFNDYVQPICLPERSDLTIGKLGRFAGFGKSSLTENPKSDLLSEAEYQVNTLHTQSFEAENTSGNTRISDIGGGFFINETNRWTLGGILSRKLRDKKEVIFTRVDFYVDWITIFN